MQYLEVVMLPGLHAQQQVQVFFYFDSRSNNYFFELLALNCNGTR